ncbi:MAG: phospho-N-acetylmuramoyl-pentapeptide-transferase [bacterium]
MDSRIFFAALIAFIISIGVSPVAIIYLRRLKFGQQIRVQGPSSHKLKAGTPTMGGLIIIFALTISTLIFAGGNIYMVLALTLTIGYGLLGFVDDFIKTVWKRSLGLQARQKLLGQIGLAALLAVWAMNQPELGTSVFIPLRGVSIDLGWFYIPFVVLVVVATSNAVNLTDGLDGLAAGTTAIALVAYTVITMGLRQVELAIFTAAVTGACIGFLWFNSYPAQVFMGDTGSLALGSALASVAVLTKTELWLILIGGVFVLETLSVIIQVLFFRFTGGRIFRMSPLHHHFELSGWQETQVVIRFWIVAVILALVAVGFWYLA